jgi:hypothetical protein
MQKMANTKRAKGKQARKAVGQSLDEALRRPTISPEELYRLHVMPVGRNGVYDACNSGEVENFRRGKKIVIPTAPLRRKLGMEA